jgi:hypothetical protein
MKNQRVYDWFEKGEVSEAVLGRGHYFIPDLDFREEHDLVLILNQLFAWAAESARERDAARGLELAVEKLLKEGALAQALKLVWSYLIVADNQRQQLPINAELLQEELAKSVHQEADRLSKDEPLRDLVLLIANRYPAFARNLGLA